MLLSFQTDDFGTARVYFTRANSVITYFTEDTDGGGAAHAHAGEFACPWSTTAAKIDAVKMAMLAETARRLQCRTDQVQLHSLEDRNVEPTHYIPAAAEQADDSYATAPV
jgi:hypothetical protein